MAQKETHIHIRLVPQYSNNNNSYWKYKSYYLQRFPNNFTLILINTNSQT